MNERLKWHSCYSGNDNEHHFYHYATSDDTAVHFEIYPLAGTRRSKCFYAIHRVSDLMRSQPADFEMVYRRYSDAVTACEAHYGKCVKAQSAIGEG